MKSSPHALFLALTLLAAALVSQPALPDAGRAQTVYQFDVFYDDRQIGHHRFEIDRLGDSQQVRSAADFQFKLLFVSLYRYQHEATEQWRGGCLTRLESTTNDNGKRFGVTVGDGAAPLKVGERASAARTGLRNPDCAGSFAYWDRQQLNRQALVNSQTGEPTPVQLVFEGLDQVAGAEARRYRLQPEGMDAIYLWYRSADAAWLQLESRRDNGVLRYRLANLTGPAAVGVDHPPGSQTPADI